MKKIDCFIPYQDETSARQTIASLQESPLVNNIFLLCTEKQLEISGCEQIAIDNLQSTTTVKQIAEKITSDYAFIYTKYTPLQIGQFGLERLQRTADDSAAGMVYADYYQLLETERKAIPTNDYQLGSVRDDFNFGSALLYCSKAFKEAVANMNCNYQFAGMYDLRLRVSQKHELFHINEFLYTEIEEDKRKSGEKQFDYVDPKNRAVQIEMEQACTEHLKQIGVYLAAKFNDVAFDAEQFPVEASVIIPVRNRAKTVADAINSVLSQECSFNFNLIIVDNFSTDGTSDIIADYARKDSRVIHVTPSRNDLGIGGCWNEGVHHPQCGKFAVQLDSDDVYASSATLQTMVNAFYEQRCAMVVGSYTMTNFAMQTIAPGLIDHKEWTPDNGRNNALRINGLGAPRAFYTPILRDIKVPNTSYGEDYALGLRISREYQIGRVYESVYLCRRWDENSDAALDTAKINTYNAYKDKIRTMEMKARMQLK